MQWDKISDIILLTSFAVLAVFAILGLIQWISRKSIKKVDKELLWFPVPLALMSVVYVIFEKFITLNTRPNGSGEPSFPSTHIMVAATIFFMTEIILPRYIKNKVVCIIADIVMLILLGLLSAGRILSDMHWPLDVVAGFAFALIFSEIYYLLVKPKKKQK